MHPQNPNSQLRLNSNDSSYGKLPHWHQPAMLGPHGSEALKGDKWRRQVGDAKTGSGRASEMASKVMQGSDLGREAEREEQNY